MEGQMRRLLFNPASSPIEARPPRRILRLEPEAILPGLPKGLRRPDAPDYLLSRTYARILGDDLPRRDVLKRLAGAMAFTAVPLSSAQAVPLLAIGIAAVSLLYSTFKVSGATSGSFEAKNYEPNQLKGYVLMSVTDDNSGTTE